MRPWIAVLVLPALCACKKESAAAPNTAPAARQEAICDESAGSGITISAD